MFGLGFPELVVILGVALLVFGPSKLPELGSGLGRAIRDFQKAFENPDGSDAKTPLDEKPRTDGDKPNA